MPEAIRTGRSVNALVQTIPPVGACYSSIDVLDSKPLYHRNICAPTVGQNLLRLLYCTACIPDPFTRELVHSSIRQCLHSNSAGTLCGRVSAIFPILIVSAARWPSSIDNTVDVSGRSEFESYR